MQLAHAQAFLAQLDEVMNGNLSLEGNQSLPPMDNPTPDILSEPTFVDTSPVLPFSAMTISAPASLTTPVINVDLVFEAYDLPAPKLLFISAFSTFINAIQELDKPMVFTSTLSDSPFPFNSVLNSGCTNHIFCEWLLFWMYNTSIAMPVKTANCSFLQTFAHGTVCFHVNLGSCTVAMVLKDCLHAPYAPINLLSVGALVEKGLDIPFMKDHTLIAFPSSHPTLSGLSFEAIIMHHLLFLNCDFVPPPASPPFVLNDLVSPLHDLSNSAFAKLFPQTSLTSELWHRHLGHPGIEATHAVLTKSYATGVEYTGAFDHSHCIPCLIGESPQWPHSNYGNRASVIGKLLHMDICGPFYVLTPQKYSSFLSILEDCPNFGFVGLLARQSDACDLYC